MSEKIKRGVAVYSYSGEYGKTMNLEDCFKYMHDMGATGVKILANSHIESYPELSDEYLRKWHYLWTNTKSSLQSMGTGWILGYTKIAK